MMTRDVILDVVALNQAFVVVLWDWNLKADKGHHVQQVVVCEKRNFHC